MAKKKKSVAISSRSNHYIPGLQAFNTWVPKLPFYLVCGQPFEVLSQRNFGTKLAPYLYTPKTTIN